MKPLETIIVDVRRERIIEVQEGDLAELPVHERFDVLVVSAFPGDYLESPTSVIGALAARGLSVEKLSRDKEYDLRANFSCWLSKPIDPDLELGFNRILVFEPRQEMEPAAERVDDIFRALAPFLGLPEEPVTSVAMPLVACGDQGSSVTQVLEPLMRAAIHWMRTSPLHRVRIVELNKDRARQMHEEAKRIKERVIAEQTGADKQFDVFLSYSRQNETLADHVVESLRRHAPDVKIFRDTDSLHMGRDYRVQLDEAVRQSRRFLPLLTPEYVNSAACKDEFNAAWSIRDRLDHDFLWPVFARDTALDDPRISKIQFEDCREGDRVKIDRTCRKLAESLGLAPAIAR
jgi:hypothetical protein